MADTPDTAPEQLPPSTPNAVAPDPTAPPAPKPKRRRWLKVVGALLLVLILLIVFAPTIAGTGPVRSMVLSRVNENLNGKVTVEDWSVGWRSGLSITRMRVLDANGIQILQLSKLTTQLTLLDAIRGKYNLGETVIDGLDALVKSDAQGVINFSTLSKNTKGEPPSPREQPTNPNPSPSPAPSKPADPTEPSRLPDLSGNIHLVGCNMTYEDGRAPAAGGSGQTYFFTSIEGVLKIPNINEPIDNSFDITCRVGRRPEGKFSTKGTVGVVSNNVVDVEHANINQTATVRQIELEALSFLFGKDSGIKRLAGMTDADVVVRAQPAQDALVTAQITSTNFALGGPALKGDTLATKSLVVNVPGVTIGRSANPNDFRLATIKAGTEAQPISIKLDQGLITAFADTSVGGLQNFAAGLAPGAAGRVHSDVDLDLGALGQQLRTMFAMKQGTQLKSAKLRQAMNITLAADRATVDKLTVDLTDVVAKQPDGSEFSPKPIHLTLSASNFGGGWAAPDLRDLDLNLESGFLSASATAKRLSDDLKAQLKADLKQFQNEWGGIVNLGDTQLAGTVNASADSQGNVVAGEDAKINANVALANITLSRAAAGRAKAPAKPVLTEYSGAMKLVGTYQTKDPLNKSVEIGSLTYKDDGKLADLTATGRLRLSTAQGTQPRATTMLEMVQSLQGSLKLPNLAALQNLSDAFSTPAEPAKIAANVEFANPLTFTRPLSEQFAAAGPVSVPASAPAPVAPPMVIDAGSATIDFNFTPEGGRSAFTSKISTQGLALRKGEAKRTLGTVEAQSAMSFVPVAPVASANAATQESMGLMDQMRDLVVAKLSLSGAGGSIFLTEPLKIAEPSGLSALFASLSGAKPAGPSKPINDLSAAIHITGDIAQGWELLKVLQADATPGTPYTGQYSFDQKVTAGKAGLVVSGGGNLDELKNADGTFREKRVHLANDVSLDSTKEVLSIRNLLLDTEATKALQLAIKGDVLDYSTQRRLQNFGGTLAYDWAKAWELVRPMLSAETQKSLNLSIAGKGSRPFAFTGSYPAGKPFNEAVRTLTGSLGLNFDLLDVEGMKIERLDLPIDLKDGHARILVPGKPQGQNLPAPADCNGGKLALGGADIDLTGPVMTLTLPGNTKVLENVGMNEVLSDRLGGWINNPLFVDPKEATGVLNVTAVLLDRFGLASPADPTTRSGRAQLKLSISKLQLGNPFIQQLAEAVDQEEFLKSLRGEVKDATITIENGKVIQDITILTAEHKRPFRIAGDADLATTRLHLTFTLPPDLFGEKLERFLPEGFPVAIGGTTRRPEYDVQKQMRSLVQKNLVPGLLEGLLGKEAGGSKDPGAKPAIPSNPEDFFDLIRKPAKDPAKEKEKKERRDKRRKEREQSGAAAPASADNHDR